MALTAMGWRSIKLPKIILGKVIWNFLLNNPAKPLKTIQEIRNFTTFFGGKKGGVYLVVINKLRKKTFQ
jgi:hypothetical protein